MKTPRHRYPLRIEPALFERVERLAGVRGANRFIVTAVEREVQAVELEVERRAARAAAPRLVKALRRAAEERSTR